MSLVNIHLQRLFNPVLSIFLSVFLSSTLRILLALLLLVSCYTCIAMSLFSSFPLVFVILLVAFNAIIFLHHWYVVTK